MQKSNNGWGVTLLLGNYLKTMEIIWRLHKRKYTQNCCDLFN